MRRGRLEAGVLDVQLNEPSDPANPLLKLPNVVLSPHDAATPLSATTGCRCGQRRTC
ncbi:MAG TPA: NAD(P)-dependent oxidoreductase [Acetobacteraceae bacterium]|nr:NAD(P)-dependent oxidoreductase [Acetobacteraceae bacterium]